MAENNNTEARTRFFNELSLALRQEGLTPLDTNDELLRVELGGEMLCAVDERGGVRYRESAVEGNDRRAALDRVIDLARTTVEYMKAMEAAPPLKASGLDGDYRLLAEFNNTVLAGHPTRFGAQFITWEWAYGGKSLWQGHYYERNYDAAKEDFALRSGLVERDRVFSPEQLTEVYRSIHETLDGEYPITNERVKLLRSAAEQMERSVSDLEQRVELSNQREMEAGNSMQQSYEL